MTWAPRLSLVLIAVAVCHFAGAAEYRSVGDVAVILYDAPSQKARPLFILGRDTPLEVLVSVEGWIKVRDADGSFGWVEKKSFADKRMLVSRAPAAEARASADDGSPLVFRAESGVLLELAEPANSASTTASPGWVKVRHADGQTGFVRITQLFGI